MELLLPCFKVNEERKEAEGGKLQKEIKEEGKEEPTKVDKWVNKASFSGCVELSAAKADPALISAKLPKNV